MLKFISCASLLLFCHQSFAFDLQGIFDCKIDGKTINSYFVFNKDEIDLELKTNHGLAAEKVFVKTALNTWAHEGEKTTLITIKDQNKLTFDHYECHRSDNEKSRFKSLESLQNVEDNELHLNACNYKCISAKKLVETKNEIVYSNARRKIQHISNEKYEDKTCSFKKGNKFTVVHKRILVEEWTDEFELRTSLPPYHLNRLTYKSYPSESKTITNETIELLRQAILNGECDNE